jgi:hypothetical protein
MTNDEAAITRFLSKVDKRGPNECWPWTGAQNKSGHGRFKFNGTALLAHRVAYVIANGELPVSTMHRSYHGKVVRHTCDNPPCCNPAHLVACEQIDNVRDMMKKGRHRHAICAVPVPPHDAKS